MIFQASTPVAAGSVQCSPAANQVVLNRPQLAALVYVASGEGALQLGPWQFPIRRGQMLAIPPELCAIANYESTESFSYYYCYFSTDAQSQDGTNPLSWPWNLGLETAPEIPCANAPFRKEVTAIFNALRHEISDAARPAAKVASRMHLLLLGVEFCRMLEVSAGTESSEPVVRSTFSPELTAPPPEAIACVLDFVQSNLDQELSLPALAKVSRYSKRRFNDIFRVAMGESPMSYVRKQRLREAKRLLLQGMSVTGVASKLNFADNHHFSRVFRQNTGISPTQFTSEKSPHRRHSRLDRPVKELAKLGA
jgi:AraC-like DNA-binding protein